MRFMFNIIYWGIMTIYDTIIVVSTDTQCIILESIEIHNYDHNDNA